MSSHYYHDSFPYRPRSPPRGGMSPSISQRHHSPPLASQWQRYSQPRNQRSRTPPRTLSSPIDRRAPEYPRLPDRPRTARSLPWQSRTSPQAVSPPRYEYHDQDRYRDTSPRSSTRRQYEFPPSREESYYTQPQYPLSSQNPSPPSSRAGRTVIEADKWSTAQYSTPRNKGPGPYFGSGPSRDRASYDSDRRGPSLTGSRESPICIEDYEELQHRDYPRTNQRQGIIRHSGAEKLIHKDWRPPTREKVPTIDMRGSWEDNGDRRQRSPVRIEILDSPPESRGTNREFQNVGRRERSDPVRREDGELYGQHWVHPDRRSLLAARKMPTPAEEAYDTQPPVIGSHQPTIPTSTQGGPFIRQTQTSPEKESRPPERTLREKAAVGRETQPPSKPQGERADSPPTEATRDVDPAEKIGRGSQGRLQMEARQFSLSKPQDSTPRPELGRNEPPMQMGVHNYGAREKQIPRQVPPVFFRNKPIEAPRADIRSEMRDHIRAKRKKKPKHRRLSHPDKSPARHMQPGLDPRKSLTALTNGEKNQFLTQMAKHAAEILFAPKPQVSAITMPHAASDIRPSPGLELSKATPVKSELSSVPQNVPSLPPVDVMSTHSVSTKQAQSADLEGRQDLTIQSCSAVTDTMPTKKPDLDIIGSSDTTVIVPDSSLKAVDPPRKRATSIISTSSGNSRHSSSPFLSAPLTSGICIVCYKTDIPPRNRLAQCSECSSLYHQSCHTPALTKAILEEAGENWYCRQCKQKQAAAAEAGKPKSLVSRRSSGLSVTLKSNDEKALEDRVMVNKSLWSDLSKKHEEWKSPKSQVTPTLLKASQTEDRSTMDDASLVQNRHTSVDPHKSDDAARPDIPECGTSTEKKRSTSSPSISDQTNSLKVSSPLKLQTTPNLAQQTLIDGEVPPSEKITQPVYPRDGVPLIGPSDKVILASQPDQPDQIIVDIANSEPTSPPIIRSKPRKRDLVINDSEEEQTPKRPKMGISPRAAMKSAIPMSLFQVSKPAFVRLPIMAASRSSTGSEVIKNIPANAKVAKKSGIQRHESASPISERGESTLKAKDMERVDLRSPVSPIRPEVHRTLRPVSQLPTSRPSDPGASQQFSLRLILTSGASKNTVSNITASASDNITPEIHYTTPYPAPSSGHQSRPAPRTSPKQRSRDKKNFDILSLVPNRAVPVLEDGKLAFREGAMDARTGQLKRGARKFKVGKIIPGELL